MGSVLALTSTGSVYNGLLEITKWAVLFKASPCLGGFNGLSELEEVAGSRVVILMCRLLPFAASLGMTPLALSLTVDLMISKLVK